MLSQLGARVQHALRAFTPDDQKALAATVKTYPITGTTTWPQALTSLGIGEAIVTVLSEQGAPTPVAWTRVRAPRSLMAPAPADAVAAAIASSPLFATYGQAVDRQSAYEMLTARVAPTVAPGRRRSPFPTVTAAGTGATLGAPTVAPTAGRRWYPSPTTRTSTMPPAPGPARGREARHGKPR